MKSGLTAAVMTSAWRVGMSAVSAQTAPPAAAADNIQHVISDQDRALLRKDLRSQKKQLIAQNLTLSDDEARSLIKNWLDVDIAAAQLRAKHLPIVSKAIGGRKAATFAQLDRRIASLVDL